MKWREIDLFFLTMFALVVVALYAIGARIDKLDPKKPCSSWLLERPDAVSPAAMPYCDGNGVLVAPGGLYIPSGHGIGIGADCPATAAIDFGTSYGSMQANCYSFGYAEVVSTIPSGPPTGLVLYHDGSKIADCLYRGTSGSGRK